jgi:hypothetical protein
MDRKAIGVVQSSRLGTAITFKASPIRLGKDRKAIGLFQSSRMNKHNF